MRPSRLATDAGERAAHDHGGLLDSTQEPGGYSRHRETRAVCTASEPYLDSVVGEASANPEAQTTGGLRLDDNLKLTWAGQLHPS